MPRVDRIQLSRLVAWCAIYLGLIGCDKINTREPDLALSKIAANLPMEPSPPGETAICASLPSTASGIITIQESQASRSVIMVFRYEEGTDTSGNQVYDLKNLHIQTSPKQIGWHARLEEEMENWGGVVRTESKPGQYPTLSIKNYLSAAKNDSSELAPFKEIIATSLGGLHTLRQWCAATSGAQSNKPLKLNLDLPGSPEIELQPKSPTSANFKSGDARFALTSTQQGTQWVGRYSQPQNDTPKTSTHDKQIIFRIFTDPGANSDSE